MARQRVTQETLARELGLSQTAISRRLTARLPFTVDELAVVARLLRLPLHALITEPDAAA